MVCTKKIKYHKIKIQQLSNPIEIFFICVEDYKDYYNYFGVSVINESEYKDSAAFNIPNARVRGDIVEFHILFKSECYKKGINLNTIVHETMHLTDDMLDAFNITDREVRANYAAWIADNFYSYCTKLKKQK